MANRQGELVLIGDFGGGTSDFTLMRLSPKNINHANRSMDMISKGGIYIGGDNFDSNIMWHKITPHFGRGVKEKLAYQLERDGEDEVALKVLALNTELFPDEYKTHENLGAHLLKMGKRDEAIVAYQKSLKLKPDNEYVIQALKDIGME